MSVQRKDNKTPPPPPPPAPAQSSPASAAASTQGAQAPAQGAAPARAASAPPAAPAVRDNFTASSTTPQQPASALTGLALPQPRTDLAGARSRRTAPPPPPPPAAETRTAGAPATPSGTTAAPQTAGGTGATTGAAPPQQGAGGGTIPATPADLRKVSAEFNGKSDEDLQKIHQNLVAVRDGSPGEKLRAMATLAGTFPETLRSVVGSVGLQGGIVDKILEKPDLLKNSAVLFDPSKSALERTGAALSMANDLIEVVGKDKLPQFLQTLRPALPVAKELTSLVQTFQDPEKTALDRAGAVVGFLKGAKDAFPAEDFPKLGETLQKFGAPLAIVENAMTLVDPSKSVAEKAAAAVQIWANIPDAVKSGKELRTWLSGLGIPKAGDIAAAAATLPVPTPPAGLSDALKEALPASVSSRLSPEDVARLNTLGNNAGLAESLGKVLKNVDDPAQVTKLLAGLEGASDATRKAMLEGLAGMDKVAMRKLMTETVGQKPALEVLQKVLSNVPPHLVEDAGKLIGKLDADAAKILLKLGDQVDGKIIGDLLGQAGRVAGEVDGKVLTQGLKALDDLAGTLASKGMKLTGEVAEKMLKGLGKMIPALGAIPAFADAYGMGKIAVETSSPEIRFLATLGAGLNVADGALGIAEAFGVGNVGLPASVALGIAEIGLDLYVNHAREQEKAGTFRPSSELRALIGATALATTPLGLSMLVGSFGIPGAIGVLTDTVAVGGNLAIAAGKELAKLQGATVEQQLNMTADAINTMADIIRNPQKYGDAAERLGLQALDGLRNMADQAGALGQQALDAFKHGVEDLKRKGEQGVEALKWLANNPGKAAEAAQKALGDLAQQGLTALDEAGKALGKKALEALDAAAKTYDSAKAQVEKTVGEIAKRGEAALETLRWAAQNPGAVADAAKKELVNLALAGGEAAKKAYDTLVGLGEQGKAAVEDLAKRAAQAGERGLQALQWVVQNPGAAGDAAVQAAVDGMKAIASGTEAAAKAARDALVKLAEDTGAAGQRAVGALADIIKNGGTAATEILDAWKGNLTRGGQNVLAALANLGDAGMDALAAAAKKGGALAGAAAQAVLDAAGDSFDKVVSFVQKAPELAGTLFQKAYDSGGLELLGKIALAMSPAGMGVMMAKWVWDNREKLDMGIRDVASFAKKVGGDFVDFIKDQLPFGMGHLL